MQVVLEGSDDARKVIGFADARRIVRRGALSWNQIPPDTGDVIVIIGLAAMDFAGGVNFFQIVIEHAIPNHERAAAAFRKRIQTGGMADPDGYTFGLVVIDTIEPDFAHGGVVLFVQDADAFHATGAIDFRKFDDHRLAGRIFRGDVVLPASGLLYCVLRALQFQIAGIGSVRARAEA